MRWRTIQRKTVDAVHHQLNKPPHSRENHGLRQDFTRDSHDDAVACLLQPLSACAVFEFGANAECRDKQNNQRQEARHKRIVEIVAIVGPRIVERVHIGQHRLESG